jgi:hypothetical protein
MTPRHAYNLIKAKCPRTAEGTLCNPEEHDCRWHDGTGKYAMRVAKRLVRMWRRQMAQARTYATGFAEIFPASGEGDR